jgi:hypothetical protein
MASYVTDLRNYGESHNLKPFVPPIMPIALLLGLTLINRGIRKPRPQ